jgi:hypothetical protein
MALDRTWYNTLVDDDGSGLTGSVWDKADVNSLMNAIDAEFARTDSSSGWVPSLTAYDGGAAGAYVNQNAIAARSGSVCTFSGRMTISSKGSLAGGMLYVNGLPYTSHSYTFHGLVVAAYWGGVVVPVVNITGYFDPGATRFGLTYGVPGGGTAVATLMAAHINSNFDLIFGGSYVCL